MFTTLIVQPIFNLLALIYALLPGHDFGLSIIIFTIIVRLLLWPLVRKQLRQAKLMRKLQPEIKEVKKKARGDRQKESLMLMELYKERGVNPIGSIGILIPQMIILIGLYSGLNRVVHDPNAIISFTYPGLQHLGWMKELAHNIHQFDETLFGSVDLTRAASSENGLYVPALIIAVLSATAQYFQSRQLLPKQKDARRLRDILKAAGQGEKTDQSEVQAATSRVMIIFLPLIILFVTLGLPSALGLYWLTGGIVAIIQQGIVLREDEEEMEKIADEPATRNVKDIPEAEVVDTPAASTTPIASTSKKSSKSSKKKRRK
jgi:YidC/Oxa1 family membrane protein insertase